MLVKRTYWGKIMTLYTDVNNTYILEVKDKIVFTNNKGKIWILRTNDKVTNDYLDQIREVYGIPKENKLIIPIVILIIFIIGSIYLLNIKYIKLAFNPFSDW